MAQTTTDGALLRRVAVVAGVLLAVKIWLGGRLELYSDEIFYWLASTRPALAYSDLPFLTALLAGAGAGLGGDNSIAVRSFFLLCGASIAPLVYWLGRPVVGRRAALEAAGLSLCMPLAGFMGLLAVPDAPLVVCCLLALGCLQRALSGGRWRWWLGAGVAAAAGLCAHYRFLPLAAGMLLFVLFYPPAGRRLNPRVWAAAAVGALGLVPMLWFNLEYQLGGVGFHAFERHPWRFQAEGLLHVARQAGIVTPPLYLLLLYTAWRLWRQARGVERVGGGDDRGGRGDNGGENDREIAALFLTAAMVFLLPYLLLAPWADENSTSIHWPLPGYFPLLVFAPVVMRRLHRQWAARWRRAATWAAGAVPVVGFCGTLLALAGVGSQAFQQPLQAIVGPGVLSNKMAGWREFAAHTRGVMDARFPDGGAVIITNNYYTAAQLEFAGFAPPIYTLDRDKAARDGRALQLRIWRLDESALDAAAGRPALLITEDSTLNARSKKDILARACRRARRLELVGRLTLYGGDKVFSYYATARLVAPGDGATAQVFPCP